MHHLSKCSWFTVMAVAGLVAACDQTSPAPTPTEPPVAQGGGSSGDDSNEVHAHSRLIVYATLPAFDGQGSEIVRLDSSNAVPDTLTKEFTGKVTMPSLSPDGHWVAFMGAAPGSDYQVYLMRADGSDMRPLTLINPPDTATGGGWEPAWSPDGQWLTYGCQMRWPADTTREKIDLCRVHPDGTGFQNITMEAPGAIYLAPTYSPDGHTIAAMIDEYGMQTTGPKLYHIMLMDSDGGNKRYLGGPYGWRYCQPDCRFPKFSPDGRKIAYLRYLEPNQRPAGGDNFPLVIASVDDPTDTTVLGYTREGASGFSWSPDGRQLLVSRRRPDVPDPRAGLWWIGLNGTATPAVESPDADLRWPSLH